MFFIVSYHGLHLLMYFFLILTDECVDDTDCSNNGACVDTKSTRYPKMQCYCNAGWYGRACEKGIAVLLPYSHLYSLPFHSFFYVPLPHSSFLSKSSPSLSLSSTSSSTSLSRYALDTHTVLKFSDLFNFTVLIQNTFSRGVRYKHNVAGHQ